MGKIKRIASAQVTSDVVALYMLAARYKKSFLSFLALYELYGRDVFVFFYILGAGSEEVFMGKTAEEIMLPKDLKDIPTDASLKLLKSRAKKISDALRRNSSEDLIGSNLAVFETLNSLCVREKNAAWLNFYAEDLGVAIS